MGEILLENPIHWIYEEQKPKSKCFQRVHLGIIYLDSMRVVVAVGVALSGRWALKKTSGIDFVLVGIVDVPVL